MITTLVLCASLMQPHHCADDDFDTQAAIPVRITQKITTEDQLGKIVPFVSFLIEQAAGKAADAVKGSQEGHEIIFQQAHDEMLKSLSSARKELRKIEWPNTFLMGQHAKPGSPMSWMDDPRVTVDIDGKSLRDALRLIFSKAKLEYLVEKAVPADNLVSLKVINVRLSTALNAVTEAVGVGWTREMRMSPGAAAPAVTYRVLTTPDVSPIFAAEVPSVRKPSTGTFNLANRSVPTTLRVSSDPEGMGQIFSMVVEEERSTFNCPHCHGQVIAFRQKQSPKCPTCQREFRSEWKFCPSDGAARPMLGGVWRFCPICGKTVSFRKP